ncbi:hypothetical protein [Halochromatium roseum]|uniref:hypothetical protein n=1 Tax=Halochromatium roseum TaxID=391920 RepID=UPI0019135A22|nr:hypothetical protein [Halochromatium roseum]
MLNKECQRTTSHSSQPNPAPIITQKGDKADDFFASEKRKTEKPSQAGRSE